MSSQVGATALGTADPGGADAGADTKRNVRIAVAVMFIALVVLALVLVRRHRRAALAVTGGGPFRLMAREPGYTELRDGKRTVEPRLAMGSVLGLKEDDDIVVVRSVPKGTELKNDVYKFEAKVVSVKDFDNIDKLLADKEVGQKAYPKMTKKEAADLFIKSYPKSDPESVKAAKVRAIEIKKVGEKATKGGTEIPDFLV